ncbi:MAG: universal stress protein [Dehalococcoidia bacterium]|nr:universal stress protein [Dehalococcoidia bacterium]MDD5493803.1 universal stress protein [Dehalococcoidia bacterium]
MAYKKILVPLNGSELAEKALPYAKIIAKLKKSQVTLFAVSLTIFVDRRDRLFTSYLEANAKELNTEGIKTTADTSYGDVAEEIVKYANNNKIDLIVMASHGYSKAKKWMFGSITQKVLYGTEIPVLLIKSKSPEVSGEFNRILVPVDGSPFSESTLPYIEELTRKTDREVLLLHICEPPIVPSYGSRPINPTWKKYQDNMWEEMEKLSTNYLKTTMTALKKKGMNVKSRVERAQTGEVVKTIMKVSKEENVDLVAIATQGRTGVNRRVYGNVANKIVEELSQPILLIRPATSIPPSRPQNLLDDIWQSYLGGKL